MTDYQKYINALRKCAKEHENDRTFTGHVIVADLCRDTANLLEELEQEPKKGHWIYMPQQRLIDETDDGCVYETDYKCSYSACGGDFGFIKNKDAFCKFCGADMREVEDGKNRA